MALTRRLGHDLGTASVALSLCSTLCGTGLEEILRCMIIGAIIFALHLAVFHLSFSRESIRGFLKVNEVYVVLMSP